MTRRIEADPVSQGRPYTHLVPLVQALIDHGNPLAKLGSNGELFCPSQGGWVAYLSGRIDWSWVQATFELPDDLTYDRREDEIFDHKNWISIRGSHT